MTTVLRNSSKIKVFFSSFLQDNSLDKHLAGWPLEIDKGDNATKNIGTKILKIFQDKKIHNPYPRE